MIEKKLKDLIIERYNSLSRFADEIDMAWTTLDGVLKRGVNKANITSLIKICNGLNIDCESLYYGRILPKQELLSSTPFNESEIDHIKKYRSLSNTDKETVDMLVDRLSIREKEYINIEPPKVIDLYPHLASAGTGQYLFDDIPIAKIEVPFECEADFAIGVNGDSMSPTFSDGDDLLIKKQNSINEGEIGIFIIDGESYVKEYQKDKLVSHNPNYPDIEFKENMRIQCVGKVIGIY